MNTTRKSKLVLVTLCLVFVIVLLGMRTTLSAEVKAQEVAEETPEMIEPIIQKYNWEEDNILDIEDPEGESVVNWISIYQDESGVWFPILDTGESEFVYLCEGMDQCGFSSGAWVFYYLGIEVSLDENSADLVGIWIHESWQEEILPPYVYVWKEDFEPVLVGDPDGNLFGLFTGVLDFNIQPLQWCPNATPKHFPEIYLSQSVDATCGHDGFVTLENEAWVFSVKDLIIVKGFGALLIVDWQPAVAGDPI